jgi:hypothetical protein
MLVNLIKIAQKVKCKYPNIKKNQILLINKYYSNYDDITHYIEDENSLMDCGSVLWNILLQYYLNNKSLNKEILENEILNNDLTQIFNPEFHLYFNKNNKDEKNVNYNLTYIKYKPFHLLYEQNINNINTNNMGYWCINLGIGLYIKNNIESLQYFDIDYDKDCYLVFWPNIGMTICNLDFIIENLINDAKNDIKYFENNSNKIIVDSTLGILRILMKQKNITFDSVEVINMGYLFEKNEETNINLCNMYMNKGNNLMGI